MFHVIVDYCPDYWETVSLHITAASPRAAKFSLLNLVWQTVDHGLNAEKSQHQQNPNMLHPVHLPAVGRGHSRRCCCLHGKFGETDTAENSPSRLCKLCKGWSLTAASEPFKRRCNADLTCDNYLCPVAPH